ncbi:MAG: rRNA maturation RNase YbeY [bacterium]|nr:rRNA maturation RNase YbeY [bacterium]
MSIDIARLVRVTIADAVIQRVVRETIRYTQRQDHEHRDVSIAFIGPKRMRELNRTYHGEDRTTDVLAFGQPQAVGRNTQPPHAPSPGGKGGNKKIFLPLTVGGGARGGGDLGEIVLCPAYVRQQAKRAGEPFRRELTRVLVHGTLHLLGHDHATPRDAERMFALQEHIVQKFR